MVLEMIRGVNIERRRNLLYIINDLFKVKQTILLLYVGVFGYLIAAGSNIDLVKIVLILLSQFLTIGGTTGVNMVLDADLDAVMMRTRNRVIPSGVITKSEAILISGTALAIGLLVSYMISWVYMLIGLAGFLIDIVVYTMLMKRRTWLSVVFGGFAGGAPALGGYVAYTNQIDLIGISLMLIVALWSSPHIWYISAYYIEDYKRANIPTPPVLYGMRVTALGSIIMLLIIYLLIAILFIVSNYRIWISLTLSSMLTAILITKMLRHAMNSEIDKREIRGIFKFLSPYLALIFLAIYLDKLFLF